MLCLGGEQLEVLAAESHKLLVGTHLDKAAAADDHDLASGHGIGEAVGDEYAYLALCQLGELIEDLLLGYGIERRGRLVEDEDIRLFVEGACYGKLLPLAARKLDAVFLKHSGKGGIVAVGELIDKHVCVAGYCGGSDRIVGVLAVDVTESDILGDGLGVLAEVLEDYTEQVVIFLGGIFLYITSVEEYLALGDVVKTGKQLDQGGLARAVETYEDDLLT